MEAVKAIDDETAAVNYYVPSPAEIAAETARIRAEWSPAEERKRRAFSPCVEVDGGRVHRVDGGADDL